jgi:peptidoglycan/LPS O-acetylase OafA/YrhL
VADFAILHKNLALAAPRVLATGAFPALLLWHGDEKHRPYRLAEMKIHFLQTARAVAAWLVVADHALLQFSPDSQVAHFASSLGSAGVYMFFVISGFIMVHIAWNSFGTRAASADFLRRRIIRIAPLSESCGK